jgi:hypothetical protein
MRIMRGIVNTTTKNFLQTAESKKKGRKKDFIRNLGAFPGPALPGPAPETGLSAPIPHKPPCGLLRDFRCNPLRCPTMASLP